MNVRKRSGKVVPFDAGFIHRAISLAAAAAGICTLLFWGLWRRRAIT